jgi:hypothetical protein
LVAVLILDLLLSGLHWMSGALPVGDFVRGHFVLAATIPVALGLVDYLDREALKAVEEFRPALRANESDYLSFRYRLVTVPARAAWWAGLAFVLVSVVVGNGAPTLAGVPGTVPASYNPLDGGLRLMGIARAPATTVAGMILILAFFLAEGAAIYHVFNQMAVISRILTHHTKVDLFRLAPLYAFSRHTARTSIVMLGAALAGFAIVPEFAGQAGVLVMSGLLIVVVAAAFVLPLTGAHRLLIREKERLITENGALFREALKELHQRVASGQIRDMDNMNKALASLEIERAALMRIPTWPWEPGTVRGVIVALVLPILVWLIQLSLGRLLA